MNECSMALAAVALILLCAVAGSLHSATGDAPAPGDAADRLVIAAVKQWHVDRGWGIPGIAGIVERHSEVCYGYAGERGKEKPVKIDPRSRRVVGWRPGY